VSSWSALEIAQVGNMAYQFLTALQGRGPVQPGPQPIFPEPMNVPAPVLAPPEPESAPVPAPEPLRVPEPEPLPVPELEPLPVPDEEMKHEPLALFARVRAPAAYAFVPEKSPKRPRIDVDEDDMALSPARCSPSNSNKRARGNFDSYQRSTIGLEEAAEVIAPEEEFKLDPDLDISPHKCEQLIRGKEQQYRVKLAKQDIKKGRTERAEFESKRNMHTLELENLKRKMRNAQQVERLYIWAETLRALAKC